MKKIALLILMFAGISYGQIKVIDTEKLETIGKQKAVSISKIGNEYRFNYVDRKYTQILETKSFSFKDEDNAFKNLYDLIIKGFDDATKEDIMLDLPNDIIWLHYTKVSSKVYFQFYHSVDKNSDVIGKTDFFTKKQVIKLFGKKK